jgi:hypothetical protein
MYIVKLRLYCPKCNRHYSGGEIRRKTIESAKKEIDYWEGVVPIFKCQRDNNFLQIDAKMEIN